MCQQIEYWNKQGITVFAFRPPAAAPLLALEDSTGNYNEHLIKQKIEQASGIWIEINANQFKTYDGSHLPTKEAEKLSKEIALSIKQKLMKR